MSTVTFRLAGPMQAWSRSPRTHGGGGQRPTQDHPTKSGVIGLVANALGRTRADDISDLAALTYAVRTDRAGIIERDFQTAGGGRFPALPGDALESPAFAKSTAKTSPGQVPEFEYASPRKVTTTRDGRPTAPATGRTTAPSETMYVADAAFTIALTGGSHLVEQVAAALHQPARLLHLGRVAYPPTGDLAVTVTGHDDPVDALTGTPPGHDGDDPGPWPVHAETLPGPVVTDQPLTYDTRATGGRREGTTLTTAPPTGREPRDFFTPGGTS